MSAQTYRQTARFRVETKEERAAGSIGGDPTINPDRAQLAALSNDPRAQAHAARLARDAADRAALARDHFAD